VREALHKTQLEHDALALRERREVCLDFDVETARVADERGVTDADRPPRRHPRAGLGMRALGRNVSLAGATTAVRAARVAHVARTWRAAIVSSHGRALPARKVEARRMAVRKVSWTQSSRRASSAPPR